MAFTHTTSTTASAWSPDIFQFAAPDVLADAVILSAATQGGTVEGDQPSVRVAVIADDDAQVTAEGQPIAEAEPALNEKVVHTVKVTQLIKLSREQFTQSGTPEQLSASVSRALTIKANELFLAAPDPAPSSAPAAGLLAAADVVDGGEIADSLDGLVGLLAELQANRSRPSGIIVDPYAWAALRKMKVGTDYNSTLLGAGTSDATPMLLSVPVTVCTEMTANSGVVVDKTAITSALGAVEVATDESVWFDSDCVAIRGIWRFGHVLTRPERCGKFTVAGSGS